VSRLAGNVYIHMQTQVEFCSCEFAILAYQELYLCNVQSYSKSTQCQAVSCLTSTDSSVIQNSICNCHAAKMSRFYNSNVQSMFSEQYLSDIVHFSSHIFSEIYTSFQQQRVQIR